MALYIWLTILLMLSISSPRVLAQQSQWISDLEQSKQLGTYGKNQDLAHSMQYCVKALGEAKQLPSATAKSVALDQIRDQFQKLQFHFDSASRWDWAEQATKWLLDIDLKNRQSTTDSFSMSTYQVAADYGKLAKYAVMQGRTAEGEKYAAQEKEIKERPLRQAKQQSLELQAKFQKQLELQTKLQKQIETAKDAQVKTPPSANASAGGQPPENPPQ